jgi:2-amino-4-hydroxy-6-hydroxymethyldihydropteridine diphosphokinase
MLMSAPYAAYIALGSNLQNPREQVLSAIRRLQHLDQSVFIKASSLYLTKPLGSIPQANYINAVVLIKTHLSPENLLMMLQVIEAKHGRIRDGIQWGPRTLDLDILLYGEDVYSSETLTIPHPHLTLRNFVLVPLCEIAPDLILPDGSHINDHLSQLSLEGVIKL